MPWEKKRTECNHHNAVTVLQILELSRAALSCSSYKYGKQNEILWNLLGQFSQKMIARTISETNLWDRKKKQCIAIYSAFNLEKCFGTIPLLLLSMVIDGESTSITHWFSLASVQDSDWNKSKKIWSNQNSAPNFLLDQIYW